LHKTNCERRKPIKIDARRTVLGAPGTIEIALANEANAATGQDGRVTDVGFSIASLTLINGGGPPVNMKDPTAPAPAARSRRK
jgi:hypothetical protein